jgi:hypothetical protein
MSLARMIPKMPVPDLIRDGYRFSDKIMRKRKNGAELPDWRGIKVDSRWFYQG